MSASSIPNLSSLRRGGGGRGRGLRTSTEQSPAEKNATIRHTDNDAATSRMSAVAAGYLQDDFVALLTNENWQRRLPLMNRGTYVRTSGIDRIVDIFLASTKGHRQIISLGAGSDTRYLRLKQANKHENATYIELDLWENVDTKIARLQQPDCVTKVKNLCNIDLSKAATSNHELHLNDYHLIACDLRRLPTSPEWLDPDLPTLLISECCLIYLSPQEADNVLSYFTSRCKSSLAAVVYEPIRPHDSFGRTMISNLVSRGIQLKTIEKYADLDKQRIRLETLGFSAQTADVEFIWKSWISQEEKERIEALEWMDE
ncbi:carboxy methyl transferase for protein phosphatase 2A, partial [Elasticomyces elasticus]